jgi:L-alanine-DL-glutamate epimerase-like enolase superfamily enzyme
VLRSDPAEIDALVDRVIDANMKFPWSCDCRALAGVDTAIWDLDGKLVVPHSSHLSLITLFSLHFMAAIPNAGPFVEFTIEGEMNDGETFYRPALHVEEGKVKIPDGPGCNKRLTESAHAEDPGTKKAIAPSDSWVL